MRIVFLADCLGRRILIHVLFNLVVANTGLYQRRRRQQRDVLKQQIRFNKQKNNSTRAVTFFSTFFFVTARPRCEILLCVDLRWTTNFPFSYLTYRSPGFQFQGNSVIFLHFNPAGMILTKRHRNSPQSNLVPVDAQFLSYSAPEYHGNEVVPRCNSKQNSTLLQGVPGTSQMTI